MIGPNQDGHVRKVSVHIERLILDGFNLTPREQDLFRATLETELAKFAASKIATDLRPAGAVSSLPLPDIQIKPALSPERLGEHVGAAVIEALKR